MKPERCQRSVHFWSGKRNARARVERHSLRIETIASRLALPLTLIRSRRPTGLYFIIAVHALHPVPRRRGPSFAAYEPYPFSLSCRNLRARSRILCATLTRRWLRTHLARHLPRNLATGSADALALP